AEALGRFGLPTLRQLAPELARELSRQGVGVNANPMKCLYERGLAQFDHVVMLDASTGTLSAEKGLEILASIKSKPPGGQVFGQEFLDSAAVRKVGFDAIDQDERVQMLFSLSRTVNEQLDGLSQEIAIMKEGGDRFDAFIKDAQRRGQIVEDTLKQFSMEDGKKLIELRETWKRALAEGTISDQKAKEELSKRINSLDTVLQLMAPNYSFDSKTYLRQNSLAEEIKALKVKSASDPPHDADYQRIKAEMAAKLPPGLVPNESLIGKRYWSEKVAKAESELTQLNAQIYQRRNLEGFLKFLKTPEAQTRTDFMRWLEHDGVELAAGIAVATLATAAIVLTFGTATPLVVLAGAGTGAMLLASDVTREIQRARGIRSDGCPLGEYNRNAIITSPYGAPQNMDFFEHVAVPRMIEFFQMTAINIVGGGVGNVIGKPLSNLTGAAKSLFIKENGDLLVKMTANAAKVNAQAAIDQWYAKIVGTVMREFGNQTKFAATAPVFEKGFKSAAKELGLDVKGGDAFLSFLTVAATSALFRAMKPTPRVKGAQPSVESEFRSMKKNEPNLTFEYSGSPETVDRYIREAKARNSVIELTKKGFTETSPEGLKVEWVRRVEGKTTTPGETPVDVVNVDSGTELSALPKKSAAPQPDTGTQPEIAIPDEIQRIQLAKEKLLEPYFKKMNEIEGLQQKALEADAKYVEEINKCPDTETGRARAKELHMMRWQVEAQFEDRQLELQEEAKEIKREIKKTDQYRQLRLAISIAEGVFPPGSYMLKVPGAQTTSVRVSIGEMPAGENPHGVKRKVIKG
ncbi:MAG: hypothetical protein K2Z81_20840, partial [Cyanobacteria bacterium]|nr:hypothetical protein [Cyanobacteriota bacterium]